MRDAARRQQPLIPKQLDHQRFEELEALSAFLDAHPELAQSVAADLSSKAKAKRSAAGRPGATGEQVLRIALLEQMEALTYRDLAFRLVDSSLFRRFARLPLGKPLKPAALQANVKRLKPETWEKINRVIIAAAKAAGLEQGRKTRTDCTVVDSNIHHPTDNSLLWDGIRVLGRLLARSQVLVASLDWSFVEDHRVAAKRLAFEIEFPHGPKDAKPKARELAYRQLLNLARQVCDFAVIAEVKLGAAEPAGVLEGAAVDVVRGELRHYVGLVRRVIDQTRRRVLEGESVPASEKLVSIFETHTDIVIKDGRDTLFGHEVCLTGGASSMILDCVIEDGNPADSTLVDRSMQRVKSIFGRAPKQAAFDGAFASKDNLAAAKELGVEDVVFHKKSGIKVKDMASSSRVYKRLRNFRAGIEGCISALKRGFHMDRANWRGLEGFKSYVWSCIISFNALLLARHLAT